MATIEDNEACFPFKSFSVIFYFAVIYFSLASNFYLKCIKRKSDSV